MKIVYCISSFNNAGGKERVISSKANYLSDVYGYEVIIVTTNQRGKKTFYPLSPKVRIVDMGIDYDSLLAHNPLVRIILRQYYQYRHKKKLENFLKKENVDIAISTWSEELYFLSYLKDRSRKIIEYHCSYQRRLLQLKEKRNYLKWLKSYLILKKEERLVNTFDALIVLTEGDKKNWTRVNRIRVIPNAVTLKRYSATTCKSKRVISVGRLEPEKGFERLIDCWAIVSATYPDWKLCIFGDGNQRGALENKIRELKLTDTICLCGTVKDIVAEYGKSSFCIMTSYSEGFSMVLVEAMSCGLPVVSYNCPNGPAEIIHDKEDGFLIPDGNSDELVRCVKTLIEDEDLRSEMGNNAQKNIQRFSEDKIMQCWKNLFEKLSIDK